MNIKCLIKCWTPLPYEMSWKEGEVVEVSDELGEKLLLNKNFVKVSDTKPETESELKEDEFRNRKKRSVRDRS